MAERTNIAWTDSTFNPWWGCSKVAPGCDHCYAELLDRRTGGDYWGPDKSPRVMSNENWRKPRIWNRDHADFAVLHDDRRRRVFAGAMGDVFDKNAPEGQRERLWQLIRETPNIDWQMLTKRAPNIARYLPDDWGQGYENVWLGVTVENKSHGIPRIDALRKIPAKIRFLSIEPLLEDLGEFDLTGIHWVIVGGEADLNARPMEVYWVLKIMAQCRAQNVPFFFKQWGGRSDKGGCLLNGVEIKEFPKAA